MKIISFFQNPKVQLIAILIFCAAIFSPALKNGFTNWDDPQYVTDNILVKSFAVKKIFTSFVSTNYHPLTTLSLALEYKLVKLNPFLYHLDNVLLHLANTALVFFLIRLMCGNTTVALLTALFFAVNPLRVESVAWVTERKDVLKSIFFLGSLYYYAQYILSGSKKRLLGLCYILFVLSCLSKPQAIALPLVLFVFDYYYRRPLSKKTLIEKIPFVLTSVLFLAIGIFGIQEWLKQPRDLQSYTYVDKIFLTAHSFTLYLTKSIIPFKISALYPYPEKTDGFFPWTVYASIIIPLSLAYLAWRFRETKRDIVFGLLFFVANMALALSLIWSEGSPFSDRFTYVPSIGLSFILASVGTQLFKRSLPKGRLFLAAILVVYVGSLSLLTYQRNAVWKNGFTLFWDVTQKYPQIGLAYSKCGVILSEANRHTEALDFFNKAVDLKPNNFEFRNNRGLAFFRAGKPREAVEELTVAIRLNRKKADAYANRAEAYTALGEYDKAMADFDQAIALEPQKPWVYFKKGNALDLFGQPKIAFDYYNKTLSIDPFYVNAYNNRGVIFKSSGDLSSAINDYSKAIALSPRLHEAYINRGNAYRAQNNFTAALNDYQKALQLSPQDIRIYRERANLYYLQRKLDLALVDYHKALELSPNFAQGYYNRSIIHKELGLFPKALQDALQARSLGMNVPIEHIKELESLVK